MGSDPKPAIALDDDCLLTKDLRNSLLGRVKEFASLSNLRTALINEGFVNFKIHYMGELWVLLEFDLVNSKNLFHDNIGVRSWFSQLKDASLDFNTDAVVNDGVLVEVPGTLFGEERHSNDIRLKENINIRGESLRFVWNLFVTQQSKATIGDDGPSDQRKGHLPSHRGSPTIAVSVRISASQESMRELLISAITWTGACITGLRSMEISGEGRYMMEKHLIVGLYDEIVISFRGMGKCAYGDFIELDHRPILLRESRFDYGPSPFCFYHYWLEVDGFNNFVEDMWSVAPDANLVKDFRPISLIRSMYKIIAKNLANRLVGVLGDIVNEVQSAFIAERQILDGPFILNEVLQWCKLKKKQSLIFKVDFEKAFDSIRWDFLDDILKKFGFGDKWCNWIQSCLRSSRGSIIINGSPTEEFYFQKGLKQGDPLSPFLFILVMESLHLSFQRVVDAMRHNVQMGLEILLFKNSTSDGQEYEGYPWEMMGELVTVCAKLADIALDASFRRKPRGGIECIQFNEMLVIAGCFFNPDIKTVWIWSFGRFGGFLCCLTRKAIDDKRLLVVNSKTRWIKYVSIKDIDIIEFYNMCANKEHTTELSFSTAAVVSITPPRHHSSPPAFVMYYIFIWDEEEEYPFVNKYPSFQDEPIVLVEEESCPVYDTDNEEEESIPVYDIDIEDVIEEEERFVGKGEFDGEEDNIEDIVVVANDLCSSMIQTILSVDFEEDINTKSHELMSFGKRDTNLDATSTKDE
ncbi:RNA-directed DNA polymerase, eukaryota, reverse transcriptase zinc-binding domain protein [Tanacetum coccineum]